MMPNSTESVRSTISLGLVISSPKTTAAPAVVKSAKAEKRIMLKGKPVRLPKSMVGLSLA